MNQKIILVKAKNISRGAFSGEKLYEVRLSDGKIYLGITAPEYLRDKNKNPLKEEDPPPGEKIEGYVVASLLWVQESEGLVVVHIPHPPICAGTQLLIDGKDIDQKNEKDPMDTLTLRLIKALSQAAEDRRLLLEYTEELLTHEKTIPWSNTSRKRLYEIATKTREIKERTCPIQ